LKPLSRKILFVALVLVVLASRLPFLEKTPFDWDSVNLVFAADDFNISQDRPQAPGYIGFVFTAKIIKLITGADHSAWKLMNILNSLLLIWGVYLLGKRLVNETAGKIAAVIALANPLVWFYGEVTSLYLGGAVVWVWLANLFLTLRLKSSWKRTALTGLLWGVSGALRPDVMVFLAPLLLYCLDWKKGLIQIPLLALAFTMGNLIWLLPTIALSNINFNTSLYSLFSTTTARSSVFMGAPLQNHLIMLTKAFTWIIIGWGWALPFIFLRQRRKILQGDFQGNEAETFLLIGFLPELIFQLMFHLVKPGYILLYFPGMLILGVKWMDDYFAWNIKRKNLIRTPYLLVVLILSAGYFLFYPSKIPPPGSGAQPESFLKSSFRKLDTLTRSRISQIDCHNLAWSSAIGAEYDPKTTIIIVSGQQYDWRRVTYMLSDYNVLKFITDSIAQIGQNKNVEIYKDEYYFGNRMRTILFLTENLSWIKSNLNPKLQIKKREADNGVAWYECDIKGDFMVGKFIFKITK